MHAENVLVNNNAGRSTVGAGVDIEGTSTATWSSAISWGRTPPAPNRSPAARTPWASLIAAGAFNSTVGGTTAAACNLISGNKGSGVQIGANSDASATSSNVVAGNFIGTDVSRITPAGQRLSDPVPRATA